MEKVKKYTGKVYSLDGTFKFTINPRDVKSPLVYESTLNGGQGQFSLVFNKGFDYVEIDNTDIIRIYQIDKSNPDGRLLYTGIVQNIKRALNADYEEITIPLLGLGSIFNYKTYNGVFNDTPGNIISDIVDLMNADYNLFTKDIITTGGNIKLDAEYETGLSIINKVKVASTYNYRICADGVVCFKEKPIAPTHEFQLGKEVYKLNIRENTEKLVNKLILKYDINTRIYENALSQTNFGLREKYIVDTSIKQNDSADEFGNQYILDNKDITFETVVEINDIYDIETIKPGNTISIYGTEVQNMQIVKMKYYMDGVTLYLEDFENFASEFNYLKG